ncbi:hypothetical protein N499_1157B, partial [Wolbachia pipientis wVitA]
GKFLNIYG